MIAAVKAVKGVAKVKSVLAEATREANKNIEIKKQELNYLREKN